MFINNSPLDRCDQILWLIKRSNLNFTAQETPFTLNVTIKKKYVNRWQDGTPDNVEGPVPVFSNELPENAIFENDDEKKGLLQQLEKANLANDIKKGEIADLENKIRNLTDQLKKSESEIDSIVDTKVKTFRDEKRALQMKHEKVCAEAKSLKQENENLGKDLKTVNVALKSAKKETKEVSKDTEKNINLLEEQVKHLTEYKIAKATEEKELKTKIKQVDKKLKSLNEKEAKLEIDKTAFERYKHKKVEQQTPVILTKDAIDIKQDENQNKVKTDGEMDSDTTDIEETHTGDPIIAYNVSVSQNPFELLCEEKQCLFENNSIKSENESDFGKNSKDIIEKEENAKPFEKKSNRMSPEQEKRVLEQIEEIMRGTLS